MSTGLWILVLVVVAFIFFILGYIVGNHDKSEPTDNQDKDNIDPDLTTIVTAVGMLF